MSESSLDSMPWIIDAILACNAFVNSACGDTLDTVLAIVPLGAAISMTITACEEPWGLV